MPNIRISMLGSRGGTLGTNARRSAPRRPLGVTLLAVLQFFSGVGLIFSSLWSFGVSSWAKTEAGRLELEGDATAIAAANISSLFALLGIAYLILGISALWLARGYIKGYEWARHKGRVWAVLSIVFVLIGVLVLPSKIAADSPAWTIISNTIVVIYLGTSSVRAFFSASSRR